MGDQPALFASADFDVRAMSFREPWASAILRPVPVGATAPGPKRIDNRSRAPGERMGKWIAIRTTDTFDHEGLDWINRTYGYGWTRADKAPAGVILGVARVVGMVTEGSHPWFFGRTHNDKLNVGWMLGDVVAFEAPVPFVPRFGLGLQPLPDDVLSKVRALWLAAGGAQTFATQCTPRGWESATRGHAARSMMSHHSALASRAGDDLRNLA